METLKEKTTRGLFWGGMNNVVQQGLGLLFGIILGRLLNPEDYGMIAMILVFQLIADYYHTPELVLLCRVAFLAIIFAALGTAQSAYLFRNMMVKEQAKCNMTATLLSSIIGVTLAFLKCGYWALAIQSMAYIGLNSLLLWYFSPWRPTLHLDFGPVRHMFKFSSKLLATTILERLNTNVMNILLGRHFTKHEVGNYNQAYQWNSKVFYLLQGTLAQVAQPVFTNVADEQERQLRILRKLMRFTAFLAFPMLFGFGLVAQEFIVLTIGEKWLESARLLQLLCICISGAFIPISSVLTNMLISKGKSGTYFWVTLALCITLIATMQMLYPYGIRSMVIAYVIIYVLWTLVWHFFVSRLTGYTLWALLLDIVPFAMIAFGVMAATWWATQNISLLALLLPARILMAAVLYYIVMRLLRVKILEECMAFIKKKQ